MMIQQFFSSDIEISKSAIARVRIPEQKSCIKKAQIF